MWEWIRVVARTENEGVSVILELPPSQGLHIADNIKRAIQSVLVIEPEINSLEIRVRKRETH